MVHVWRRLVIGSAIAVHLAGLGALEVIVAERARVEVQRRAEDETARNAGAGPAQSDNEQGPWDAPAAPRSVRP